MSLVFLGGILAMTAAAFIVSPLLDASLEADLTVLLTVIFLGVACVNLFTTRFVLLPGLLKKGEAPLVSVAIIGYAFAEAPAVYGLVLALMTAEGWRAAPFGAIAFISWLVVHRYITTVQQQSAEDEFPRL